MELLVPPETVPVPIQFERTLKLGSRGSDVVAVKRALARAGFADLYAKGTKTKIFGPFAVTSTKRFQKAKGIPQTGQVGPITFKALLPYFDAYSKSLYHSPDQALATARQMIEFGYLFDRTYVYGGEHDSTLQDDNPHGYFDCSSSVSFMLFHFKLLPIDYSEVSGWFDYYGEPGPGKYVTIFANSEHVWIRFNIPEGYYRFDTSPHGDGPRGPRIRRKPRFESGFVVRHPKGL